MEFSLIYTRIGTFNAAYIVRFNATLRTWIPALTRRSRMPGRYRPYSEAAMFWTGTVNFLANGSDVDGDTLSVSSVSTLSNGSVAINPDDTVIHPHSRLLRRGQLHLRH